MYVSGILDKPERSVKPYSAEQGEGAIPSTCTKDYKMSKLYIAVLDEFPDYMTPTLVAHSVLSAHEKFRLTSKEYYDWYNSSFKKCVVRVNQKEFDKIVALPNVYLGHENKTLEGRKACAVVCPRKEVPNVLKFAKLWKPL